MALTLQQVSPVDPRYIVRMAGLGPALARVEEGWRDARRLLVSPFVKVGRLEPAIAALERLVDAYPARTDDRRLLASLLGRSPSATRRLLGRATKRLGALLRSGR